MSARPLKSLLSFHYALITLIPFLLIFLLTSLVVFPNEKSAVEDRHRDLALAVREKIETFLNTQMSEIRSLDQQKHKDVQSMLDEAVARTQSLNALYVVSSSGIIKKIAVSFAHPGRLHEDLEQVNISGTDTFKMVSSAKKAVWTNIFISVVTGGQAIAYAVPKGDSYLIGEVSLDEIRKYLKRISPSDDNLILIADQKGQIIADKEDITGQFNVSNLQLIKGIETNKNSHTSALTLAGIDYIATASDIGSLRWRSLIATKKKTALSSVYKTIEIIFIGLLGSLLLAGLSSKLLIRKFSSQVESLLQHTMDVARNGAKPEWSGEQILEFDQIVDSLHKMSEIIEQRESSILDALNYIGLDRMRFECLYELSRISDKSEKEILDYALEAATSITGSEIGYIYLLDNDEAVLTLHSWSQSVMAKCSVASPPAYYQVNDTGLWGEAVRQRRAVITNDYAAPHPAKRGCPEGHVPILRHLNLPVFYQGKIVLLAGVGNKKAEYDNEDIHQLNLLLDAAWLLIQKKRNELLLKESEERSLQMFQQNDDALVFYKLPAMRPLDANSTAFRLLGCEQHDLQHLSVRRMYGRTGIKSLFAAIRSEKSDFIIDRLKCYRRDGSALVVSTRGRVLTLKNEKVLLCSLRDMTAKIQLEEEIKATQAKLIQANKMSSLGLLVSSIAHEINNPNQSVGMNAFIMGRVWRDAAALLEECHGNDESFRLDGVPFREMKQTIPQIIEAINQSSRRIDSYIQRLMGFVKDGKGGLDTVIDLNSAVENAVSILWYQIRSGTHNFRTALSDNKSQVLGNTQQIEQVIINLITNALQALTTPANAVTVTTGISADGSSVTITVQDEGRGMSRATLDKIAEPFFSTRQDEGGTGLGVYITTNIVKEHQGTIEYDSEAGRGTTVTVRLPAAENTGEGILPGVCAKICANHA